MNSPDLNATGLVDRPLDPLRYQSGPVTFQPTENGGLIAALIAPGSSVLDIGCGRGSIASHLQEKRDCSVTGVEPDPDRAESARSRGISVTTGYIEDLGAEVLGRFDAVVFGDVLEHLPNPAQMLESVKKFLRPGGCVVASVPNVAHWSVRWDLLWGRFNYQSYGIMDATHLRWFTEKTLRQLFESTGFRVSAVHVTAGVWMPEYRCSRIWRNMTESRRNGLIRRLIRWWPRLFGCQLVIRAEWIGEDSI